MILARYHAIGVGINPGNLHPRWHTSEIEYYLSGIPAVWYGGVLP
jgi:hypothetical protein